VLSVSVAGGAGSGILGVVVLQIRRRVLFLGISSRVVDFGLGFSCGSHGVSV
jgi:hypothetical protein